MQCKMQRATAFKVSPTSTKVRAVQPPARSFRLGQTAVQPKTFVPQLPSSQSSQPRTVSCNGLFGLGLPEIAVIAGIAALVFGPSKLPELGKGLGTTVKSFQTAAKEFEKELKEATKEDAPADAAAAPKKEEEKKSQ